MRGKLSILLTAALLLGGLTSCGRGADPSDASGGTSAPVLGSDVTGKQVWGGVSDLPEADPALEYDPGYTLDIDYPKTAKGALELPVAGATGYASVRLGLWDEIPDPEELSDGLGDETLQTEDPAGSQTEDSSSSQTEDPAGSQAGDASTQEPGDSSALGGEPSSGTDESQETGLVPEDGTVLSDGEASAGEQTAETLPEELPQDGEDSQDGEEVQDGETDGQDEDVEEIEEKDPFEGAAAVLEPGTAFVILEEDEEGDWWYVKCKAGSGWIENRYCLINLPDVIPSMVYNATNSYSSRFVTLGRAIPNVTGRAFYPGKAYNERLGREEFMMPVLYPMSKHICQAQQAALAQGNTLVLYEGYRPHEVQTTVYKALSALSRSEPEVKEGVAAAPWNLSWFIAGGYSNHQRGFAMDVTLARIDQAELQTIGGRSVLRVLEYEEYAMPTPIHELSKAAATFTAPVASHSPTAWKSAVMTDAMASCPPALALQRYCTGAGLTPLASEWWHFNDLETRTSVLDNLSTGGYKISQCLSVAP